MSGSSGTSGRAPSAAPRGRREESATEKSAMRLAAALEDAGQLQEAARVHEQIGEHAQAAMLRLEHARTLRDEEQRLTVLREGAARIAGDTPQGQALHRSLARELLSYAQSLPDGVRRRGILQEAAQALVEADQGEAGGEIFERLGLLGRAIEAYERGGAITRLELLLEVRDRRERASADLIDARSHVEAAVREGARRSALEWLGELVRPQLSGEPDREILSATRRRAELEQLRPSPQQLRISWTDETDGISGVLTIRRGDTFMIGRSPQADLPLWGPELSREHVMVRLRRSKNHARGATRDRGGGPGGQGPEQELEALLSDNTCAIEVIDQGSRSGTFIEGDALTPNDPLALHSNTTLEVGTAARVILAPVRDDWDGDTGPSKFAERGQGSSHPAVLIAQHSRTEAHDWHYFTQDGGPLWLTPGKRAGARAGFHAGWFVLDADPGVEVELNRERLAAGARVELLRGDRLRLGGQSSLLLEVRA